MKTTFTFIIAFFTFQAIAQINALTEKGEEVLLLEDGTWKYVESDSSDIEFIPVNKEILDRHKKSTFLVKSNNIDVGVYLNPKEWSFEKANLNPAAEYQFTCKNLNAWGMLISEDVSIDLEQLGQVAYSNAKAVSDSIEKVTEEYRTVNGNKVLFLEIESVVQGVALTYLNYYYSNESGSTQFLTWTYAKDMDEQRDLCFKLLNGLKDLSSK